MRAPLRARRRARGGQAAFRFLDCLSDILDRLHRAKCFCRQRPACGGGDLIALGLERSIVFLDPRDMGLYRGVETDPLGSQDQFMQVLAMLCVDIDSGTATHRGRAASREQLRQRSKQKAEPQSSCARACAELNKAAIAGLRPQASKRTTGRGAVRRSRTPRLRRWCRSEHSRASMNITF
jgi:hypothetical protein